MKDDDMVLGLNPAGDQVVPARSDGAPRPPHRLVTLLLRFRNQLANLTAFTTLEAASYLIPVLTIPYFSRTLVSRAWGSWRSQAPSRSRQVC